MSGNGSTKLEKEGWFLYLITTVNCLSPNVWAFIFVMIGTVLVIYGKDVIAQTSGSGLITGGFAVFQARLSGGRVSDITSGSNVEVRREVEIKAVKPS
jgi:hypothetical protein